MSNFTSIKANKYSSTDIKDSEATIIFSGTRTKLAMVSATLCGAAVSNTYNNIIIIILSCHQHGYP